MAMLMLSKIILTKKHACKSDRVFFVSADRKIKKLVSTDKTIYYPNLAARRDLSRAALLAWIRPFEAALSIADEAALKVSSLGAATNFLIEVRIADFCSELRTLAAVFNSARLIADLILAILSSQFF